MERENIDRLRDVCGTLPNRIIRETTNIYYGCEMLDVELVDEPKNPYKSIFAMATATWGDESYRNKWKKVSILERYIVVASALQGLTLPTAVESPKYTFRIVNKNFSVFNLQFSISIKLNSFYQSFSFKLLNFNF